MSEHEQMRAWKTYRHTDGELMVPIADVLTWLRVCEETWANILPERPAVVTASLADTLRDVWLEGTDHRTEAE